MNRKIDNLNGDELRRYLVVLLEAWPAREFADDHSQICEGLEKLFELVPHWTDDVSPSKPVICWVWDDDEAFSVIASVDGFTENSYFQFTTASGDEYIYAKPVKPSDLYTEQK
jgi:hypothetical protein